MLLEFLRYQISLPEQRVAQLLWSTRGVFDYPPSIISTRGAPGGQGDVAEREGRTFLTTATSGRTRWLGGGNPDVGRGKFSYLKGMGRKNPPQLQNCKGGVGVSPSVEK